MEKHFEKKWQTVVDTIITPCKVGVASLNITNAKKYTCIWDTGAMISVVSNRVAKELGLVVKGQATNYTAAGVATNNLYLTNIILPNGIVIPYCRVLGCDLGDVDVLIGMDIISQGSFLFEKHDDGSYFRYSMNIIQ